jgi:hypothetical protein
MYKNRHLWILLFVTATVFFVNLDAIYVNIMEARNFTTAREMLHDGNWLLTTLNGEPRYQKPPLPTWLTAFSAAVFGLKSLFALRLPAALLTLVLILFSYRLCLKLTAHKVWSFVSALIMATSFYIIFAGRNGQWDIFTHGFMMGCIYFLYRFFTEDRNQYKNALIAALFFGCSFMSKGPVSLYALLLPFLISFGIVYRYKGLRSRIFPILLFLIVGLLLSGWWHWYTYTYDPVATAEITKRETSNWTGYNVRPFYYYWSFFTQSGIWTIPAFVGLLYPYLKDRVFDKKAYLFTFLWTVASVVLLSIIPEKKSRYLLPVLIPLALNTGFYIEYLFRRFSDLKNPGESLPVYFNFGLIAFIALIFPVAGYFFLNEQLSGNWLWFALLSVSLILIGFFMFKSLFRKRIRPVFYLTVMFIMAVICFGMPLAKTLTINTEYRSLEELNAWEAETQVKVYEFTYFTPELIWAYGGPIEVLTVDEEVQIPSEAQFGVLVAAEDVPLFEETFKNYRIEKVVRYDMNAKGPEDSSHKTRLWRDLYLVSNE